MEIRELRDGDLELLERTLPSPHHRRRAARQEDGTGTLLLAWHDGRPVGYLLIHWDGADEEVVQRLLGTFPELNAVAVAPALRSRGIGTALIREAERRVVERRFSRVGLAVGIDNPRARSLYERLGYRCWRARHARGQLACPRRRPPGVRDLRLADEGSQGRSGGDDPSPSGPRNG